MARRGQVALVFPERGGVDGLRTGLQDPGMVSFQVAAAHLDGHLVVVAELQEEIHRGVAAAGDRGITAHRPVLARGVWGGRLHVRLCLPPQGLIFPPAVSLRTECGQLEVGHTPTMLILNPNTEAGGLSKIQGHSGMFTDTSSQTKKRGRGTRDWE